MVKSRTKSMELRAIRQQMQASPPPPPAGTTVREWFTGLALMNPELMRGLDQGERVAEAMRLADELVQALATPRTPSQQSMAVPEDNAALTQSWNDMCGAVKEADKKERQEKVTSPAIKRRATASYNFSKDTNPSIPPPPVEAPAIHFKRASDMLVHAAGRSGLPFPSVHSSLHPDTDE